MRAFSINQALKGLITSTNMRFFQSSDGEIFYTGIIGCPGNHLLRLRNITFCLNHSYHQTDTAIVLVMQLYYKRQHSSLQEIPSANNDALLLASGDVAGRGIVQYLTYSNGPFNSTVNPFCLDRSWFHKKMVCLKGQSGGRVSLY